MYLKDQTEKRSLKQLKIWTLKRTGARKGNWDVAISEIGVNLEGYKSLEAEKRKYLSRRKWWLTNSSAMEELSYMRTKNYLGIMTLRRVISVEMMMTKDWLIRIEERLVTCESSPRIYLMDIFLLWTNNICSNICIAWSLL